MAAMVRRRDIAAMTAATASLPVASPAGGPESAMTFDTPRARSHAGIVLRCPEPPGGLACSQFHPTPDPGRRSK